MQFCWTPSGTQLHASFDHSCLFNQHLHMSLNHAIWSMGSKRATIKMISVFASWRPVRDFMRRLTSLICISRPIAYITRQCCLTGSKGTTIIIVDLLAPRCLARDYMRRLTTLLFIPRPLAYITKQCCLTRSKGTTIIIVDLLAPRLRARDYMRRLTTLVFLPPRNQAVSGPFTHANIIIHRKWNNSF